MRIALLIVLVGVAAICFALALYGYLNPAYSDQELLASLVDTWEVSALFTVGALVLLLACGLMSALLSWGASRSAKRLAAGSSALSLAAAGMVLGAHAELTERTTQVTGQTFGSFYGLF